MKIYTLNPVERGEFNGVVPEWGRTDDVRRIFGLKRGFLYNLHNQRLVNGKLLRKPGNKSGVRLWEMQSIREFINSHGNDEIQSERPIAA